MATYASTSNPFIKLNEVPSKRRGTKKEAPGMAKPELPMVEQKQSLLINTNDTYSTQTETSSSSSSKTDNNNNNNSINQLDEENTKSCCSNEDDSFEITKACESLVEMTVKLELEEKKSEGLQKNIVNEDNDFEEKCNKKASVVNVGETREQKTNSNLASCNNFVIQDDFEGDEDEEQEVEIELAPMERDDRRHQHIELIKKLRLQLRDLERYAYERGELDQVPASVIAERQSVILDTLKERLSLNISRSEIESLALDDLKKQVDREIQELIDPLKTKEHLLGQLKTQLTDLERYISHLHGKIGKIHDKKDCSCKVHGCWPYSSVENNNDFNNNIESIHNNEDSFFDQANSSDANLISDEALPKSTKLIRSLVTQLICSDIKLREKTKNRSLQKSSHLTELSNKDDNNNQHSSNSSTYPPKHCFDEQPIRSQQQFNDNAAWSLHIDKVILATDSLVNLFNCAQQTNGDVRNSISTSSDKPASVFSDNLVESIVRRQLVPAIRDLLSYGIIDPSSIPKPNSYVSILFDPYYILSSLTCFPSSQKASSSNNTSISNTSSSSSQQATDKIHVWNIVEDYYNSKNEPVFKSSSAKTLSQSFNLAPSISGPIKITSKQALLIAVEDIIDTLSKCKPNGPESHFKYFIYSALNRKKLSFWLRLIFKNKSVNRKYYFNYSFTNQSEKMDKFLNTLDALSRFDFKLSTDAELIEQFVSAF